MPELTLEFEAYCGKCGAGICSNVTAGSTSRRGYPYISIEPCEKCLEARYEEGWAARDAELPAEKGEEE